MEEEKRILEFTKSKAGVSVNVEDNTQVLDVLIGIGLTIDMVIRGQKTTKKHVLADINKIVTEIEKYNRNEKGELENGSK